MLLKKDNRNQLENWIYRNGRYLDVVLWDYYFNKGDCEKVLDALKPYQNEDGGFGHGLEPDNWNPHSTPYTTLYALNLLSDIGFYDYEHPLYKGINQYLEDEIDFTGNYWRFSVVSNDLYPHAPWWSYDEKANETDSIGITAEFVAYILSHFDSEKKIYQKALGLVDVLFEKLMTLKKHGDMGLKGYSVLFKCVTDLQIELAHFKDIKVRLHELVHDAIKRDYGNWSNYGVRPSLYISSPHSPFYSENHAYVKKELDYLIEEINTLGIWEIPWTWFENIDIYPDAYAISQNWWKANKAIEKMRFLDAFKRLE